MNVGAHQVKFSPLSGRFAVAIYYISKFANLLRIALRILGFISISYRLRGFLDFALQVTNGRANGWIP